MSLLESEVKAVLWESGSRQELEQGSRETWDHSRRCCHALTGANEEISCCQKEYSTEGERQRNTLPFPF